MRKILKKGLVVLLILALAGTFLTTFIIYYIIPLQKQRQDYLLFSYEVKGLYAYNNSPVQSEVINATEYVLTFYEDGFMINVSLKDNFQLYSYSFKLFVNDSVSYINMTVFEQDQEVIFYEAHALISVYVYNFLCRTIS